MADNTLHRRQFLKTAAGAAGFLLATPYLAKAQEALISRPIKVGLVGCGGRGLGAIRNALEADSSVIVWALADAFKERIDFGSSLLQQQFSGRMQADASRCFVGLDAYQKLLATDIDVVLLCTPPAFRPEHIATAITANKHIFAEKPLAVDIPGIMSVLESARIAANKELVIMDGFCWRHDKAMLAAHAIMAKGSLGKVLNFDGIYATTPPKSPLALDSRPPDQSDVSWALRNWTAWNWLSGGQFVEQVIHTIDGMMWSMGDKPPIAAFGSGGRAQRKDDGDVWDHYDVYFEYEHETMGHISCRQWVGCHGEIIDRTYCEKGILITPNRPHIQADKRWRYRGEKTNMYTNTHIAFYKHLRAGEWTQTLESAAIKNMVAIMGREAAQTGQRITWEDIGKNTTLLVPNNLTMDSTLPMASIPVPGKRQ
ncbi:MAG: Gfo/Idh/MocA family oxidoreductase [Akkermansia sp.]